MVTMALPIIIGLGAGILALIALGRKAEAAPPVPLEPYIPNVAEIMASGNMAELNSYYDLINELFITGQIDHSQYATLYDAYVERFNKLIGSSI